MKTNLRFAALALFFLIAGATTGVNAQEKPDPKLAGQAKVSMDEARKTALERVPGTVESSELEKEHGKLVYSFDIRTAEGITEVWVDAKSGEVINMEKETAAQEAAEKHKDKAKQKTDDDDDEESEASQKANQAKYAKEAKITMDEAKAIALKEKPGTITDQELEKEHGKLLYSFDIRDAVGKVFDVEIDAKTGKVLKVVEDTEDEQDDDN